MTDDTRALIAKAAGMRHLAWANDAPGMATWPGLQAGEDATTYIVRNDVPALLELVEQLRQQIRDMADQIATLTAETREHADALRQEVDMAESEAASLRAVIEQVRNAKVISTFPGAGRVEWYYDIEKVDDALATALPENGEDR